jgi:shikimate dehydrogenase
MSREGLSLVGLLGWPVEHSVSPAMHNAAFRALDLDWHYLPLPVRPDQLAAAVQGLGLLGFRGANVTIPHKEAVLSCLNPRSVAPKVWDLGAVNTLVVGRAEDATYTIFGDNTDDVGAVAALRKGGFEPEDGGRVVVVGAGGAARAVTFGLLWSGIGQVVLLNRTLARARDLVSDLGSKAEWSAKLQALSLETETLVEACRTADLLVNATPLGMWPRVDDTIWPEAVPLPRNLAVFDMVYNPLETRLLGQARASGTRPIGGLEMLVRQGAIAFEMWTGEPPPLDVMRAAARQALATE